VGTAEELDRIGEATLRRLDLPTVHGADESFEVYATVLGPREEPLEGPMRESLAEILAGRVRRAIVERATEGQVPVGITRVRVAHSDEADCEGPEGRQVSAFMAGERCYRIVLGIASQPG
jgi:hypothetical protein